MLTPTPALMEAVRRSFHKYGFAGLSMVDMARECGFTRRSLYNYFRSKDDALRALIRYGNVVAVQRGLDAGDQVRREGGDAVDILTAIMNIRYGETRRDVETSPHTVELNAIVFMMCRDILIDFAISFQRELTSLLVSLAADGYLRLRDDFAPADIAQTLANGARGVNQALPPAGLGELEQRYRGMCRAVLFGTATELGPPGALVPLGARES